MAAAASGDSDTDKAVQASIYEITQKLLSRPVPKKKANVSKPKPYNLTFMFDGVEYQTTFNLTEIQMTNECVSLFGPGFLESSIHKNSPDLVCFKPGLYETDKRPTGVTTTDILQTLSTKLKFTIHPELNSFEIYDVARLETEDGDPYKTNISEWRLVRGEKTLYEKYGYTADDINTFRAVVIATKWSDIKEYKVPQVRYISLDNVAKLLYPGKFSDDDPISECMKKISYEEIQTTRLDSSHTIVHFVMKALEAVKGVEIPSFYLTIDRESPTWKEQWEPRLQFKSFEPKPMGGGGHRHRKKKTRKRRRSRY